MRLTLLLALVLLVPRTASADWLDVGLPVINATYGVAGYWDAINTAVCKTNGQCEEGNPLLAWIVTRRSIAVAMTVKGGLHVGIAAGAVKIAARKPDRSEDENRKIRKKVFWSMVALTTIQIGVNAYNSEQLRKVLAAGK
jgi:hypothetical protein